MPAFIDITGQKYGRLTAIKIVSTGSRKKKGKWLFRCDCGNEIVCAACGVKSGNTKSCGCLKREKSHKTGVRTIKLIHQNQITHNMTGKRIYRIYKNMKTRCYNPKTKCYPHYGGKGIKICNEWLNDPCTFINWALSHGYNDSLTIDRIDSDGDYCPENCRFITQAMQTQNTSRNRFIELNGVKKTVSQWAREYGISPDPIYELIGKGISPVDAMLKKIPQEKNIVTT